MTLYLVYMDFKVRIPIAGLISVYNTENIRLHINVTFIINIENCIFSIDIYCLFFTQEHVERMSACTHAHDIHTCTLSLSVFKLLTQYKNHVPPKTQRQNLKLLYANSAEDS